MADVDPIEKYGFTPVPRDPEVLLADHPTASGTHPKQDPFTLVDLPIPDSDLVRKSKAFVRQELDTQTFNHSHRVFIYGSAIVRTHFPQWKYDPEVYYLSCLFHDIGACKRYLASTKMSFEFKGAIVARESILQNGGPEDMADSVCEAVIRHQDLFVKGGNITAVGQALQLATIVDNVGRHADLIHPDLIKATVAAFPRLGWGEHFPTIIEKELCLKPWCHTSTFEIPNWKEGVKSNFATHVRGNTIMNKYD